MKRVNFFSGQVVQQEDLAYLQNSLCDEIKSRTANQYTKGVVSPTKAYVGVDTNQTLKILPFTAYTSSGEQIVVPSDIRQLALDLTDSTNRQLGTQGYLEDDEFGWESDTPYIIVAKYSEEAARPRPHYRTRQPYATRIYSGFKFYALREDIDQLEEGGINPYIVLAKAIYTDGKLIVTTTNVTEYAGLDATRINVSVGTNINNTYTVDSSVTVDQHIRSVGDSTKVSAKNPHGLTAEILGIDSSAVPEHEKTFHSQGFIGSPNSVKSCFYSLIDGRTYKVDLLKVFNLVSGENLHYEGNTLKSYSYPTTELFIELSDDNGIWPDGTYTLFINMLSGDLGIASNIKSVSENRTYNIIYSSVTQKTAYPISIDSLNTQTNYVLYSFEFSQEKVITEMDLQQNAANYSNFVKSVDYRVFGSISGNNLQKDANGDFVIDFPIKTPTVKFNDGTYLTSANAYTPNYIDSNLRVYYDTASSISVGAGLCKDSTNSIVMILNNDITKKLFIPWSKGTNQGCKAPSKQMVSGTWHVFIIGRPDGITDIAIDTELDASNLVSSNLKEESGISGYRYYRRIGSIYITKKLDGSESYEIREFVTLPDGGNGVTTYYTFSETDPKQYISVVDGVTHLPVPSIYKGGTSPKYSYITIKMNIITPSNASVGEYLPKSSTEALTEPKVYKVLPTGDIDITSYNGSVKFTNNDWSGRIISYYDPRIA